MDRERFKPSAINDYPLNVCSEVQFSKIAISTVTLVNY